MILICKPLKFVFQYKQLSFKKLRQSICVLLFLVVIERTCDEICAVQEKYLLPEKRVHISVHTFLDEKSRLSCYFAYFKYVTLFA